MDASDEQKPALTDADLEAVAGGMRYTDVDRESDYVQDCRDDGWFTANVLRPVEGFGSSLKNFGQHMWERFTVDREQNPPGFRPSDIEGAAERIRTDSMTQGSVPGDADAPWSPQNNLVGDVPANDAPASPVDEAGFEQAFGNQASPVDEAGFEQAFGNQASPVDEAGFEQAFGNQASPVDETGFQGAFDGGDGGGFE